MFYAHFNIGKHYICLHCIARYRSVLYIDKIYNAKPYLNEHKT